MERYAQSPEDSEFLSVRLMLKAVPQEDAGQRVIYCEASDESLDAQNEVVLQKALADSMEYMLARGNFDIDHLTMTGAKLGVPDYLLYEIGRPSDIRFRDGKTFVKGFVYSGDGPAAERANYFWSSLTDIRPPARWFPSVGGQVLKSEISIDPERKARVRKITEVRWANIGFSKQPVNQQVTTVDTVPMDVFVKSWAADGIVLAKTLTAGYGTDAATLEGGGAVRKQSLFGVPLNYFDFRDRMASDIRSGKAGKNPGIKELVAHGVKVFGLSRGEAAEHVERMVRDIKTGLKKRSKR